MSAPDEQPHDLASRTRAFYCERIPAQFNRALAAQAEAARRAPADVDAQRLLAGMQAVTTSLGIVVDDDPRQTWWLDIDRGQMRVAAAPAHPILLTLGHAASALAAIEAEAGTSALGFLGAIAGLGVELKLTQNRVAQLAETTGSIRFTLRGEDGFTLVAAFGAAALPAAGDEAGCTLALDRAAYALLRSGELDIQDAFLTAQVEVTGDMQLAMQLALAVVSAD